MQFSDFAEIAGSNRPTGLIMPASGLIAPGATYSMRPKSSTKAAPTTGTNPLTLMCSVAGLTGVEYAGWTLRASDQGHLYNGVTFDRQIKAHVHDVTVIGVPGSGHEPPGETFPINAWHDVGGLYEHIEVDGQGVSAASFGANSCSDITVNHLNAHDCPFSRPAFWRTDGITLNDLRSLNNWGGLNLEQSSGRIRVNRPVLKPLGAETGHGMHLHLNNIAGDNQDIVITDPDTGGAPFKMHIMDAYTGGVVGGRQTQRSYPTITRGGVALTWLDAGGGGWQRALADPLRYAVRFH